MGDYIDKIWTVGKSGKFYNAGYKSSVDMPKWLSNMGLSAYEYQCNRGVRIGEGIGRKKLVEEALKYDIFLSIHAPYYINLASPEKKEKKINKLYYRNFKSCKVDGKQKN